MILPTYRPIYRDELTYGWICDLAEMNFSGDIYRIQRTAKMLFPYGYAPERRYAVRKGEKVRLDYMLGLDESLRRLRDDGYHVPETDDLITYNTVLGTMSICRKPSTQARYMYTALTTVYGDLLDMPAPAVMTAFDTFGRQAVKTEVAAGISRVRVPVSGYCTLERK